MPIIIGADIVPTETNKNLFETGNVEPVVGSDLLNMLCAADFRIFNQECPLVDRESPIQKCGPVLGAGTSCINGIKALGADLLSIANNHIMDHGYTGLESTIKTIESKNIAYLGAGNDLRQAVKPFVFSWNNKKIGVYSCAEHEFSIAGENTPGANPFDPLESYDHVVALKAQCDFLIVLYHGGKEYYRYPSPMLQRVCRKFVEKGANLVVCQHSHCIGCEEKYGNGSIVYGQGNFVFDKINNPLSQTSLLIKVNDDFSIEYIPLIKVEKGVRLATGGDAEKIISEFINRSELIKEKGFIEREYLEFAKKKLKIYMLTCFGYKHKFFYRVLNKLTGNRLNNVFVNSYKKEELLAIRNFIECEAHRELWAEGLKNATC